MRVKVRFPLKCGIVPNLVCFDLKQRAEKVLRGAMMVIA